MSRIASLPIDSTGVELQIATQSVLLKGKLGGLEVPIHKLVEVSQDSNVITVKPRQDSKDANMQAGTCRALVNNAVIGVKIGFSKKLELVGVGYRAQVKGKMLALTLGFSHPIEFAIPVGITIETPSQTEVVVKGIDKQLVGQIAAKIRAYRPPEPYKGKGVRYADEEIILKEGKKK